MEAIYSIDNFEDGGIHNNINSPRSLGIWDRLSFSLELTSVITEACLRLGLDPVDLEHKPKRHFASKELTAEQLDVKYNFFERKRQGKLFNSISRYIYSYLLRSYYTC